MHRLFLMSTVLLGSVPQEPAATADAEKELSALIDKTNGLQTLHLIYESESRETKGKHTFEFVYRAPDFARLHISGDEIDQDCWTDAEWSHWSDPSGGGPWRKCAYPEPSPAWAQLNELFPPKEKLLEPGAVFTMNLTDDPGTSGVHWQLGIGQGLQNRTCILGWLELMRGHPRELSIEGDSIVLEEARYRLRISRETGMLQGARFDGEHDQTDLLLRVCAIDEPLGDALVTLPHEADAAELDPEMARAFESHVGFVMLRRLAYLRVEEQLGSGRRPWNGVTRNDWRTFQEMLQRQAIASNASGTIAEYKEATDQRMEWARSQREKDASSERDAEVRKKLAGERSKLEGALATYEKHYRDSLPHIGTDGDEPRPELFEVENEVIGELWGELVRDPVLGYFDEQLSAALER